MNNIKEVQNSNIHFSREVLYKTVAIIG